MRAGVKEQAEESLPALVGGAAKEDASRLLGQKSQERLQLLLGAKSRDLGQRPHCRGSHGGRAGEQVLKRPVLKVGRNTRTVPTASQMSMF